MIVVQQDGFDQFQPQVSSLSLYVKSRDLFYWTQFDLQILLDLAIQTQLLPVIIRRVCGHLQAILTPSSVHNYKDIPKRRLMVL